jgi:hypothetical protein
MRIGYGGSDGSSVMRIIPPASVPHQLSAASAAMLKLRDWRAKLDTLRRFFLRQYRRLVYISAMKWIKDVKDTGMNVSPKALAAIREGLYRVSQSTWWEWEAGSTPFFWRWSEEFQERIRDGIKHQPVAFVKPPKDGGRPVLLEFDGLPEIPRCEIIFHAFLSSRPSVHPFLSSRSCCALTMFFM